MEACDINREKLIDGLSRITGIGKDVITSYARESDVLHVIDHPMVIGVETDQYEKIVELREFLNAYQVLRKNEHEKRKSLSGPDHAKDYFISQLAYYRERELILCAFLNTKAEVISCEKVSQGTVDCAALFPREIVKRVIQLDAAGIILAHNHPGNSLAPSQNDLALTRRLYSILSPLEVKLLDHIIVGGGEALSLCEMKFLPNEANPVSNMDYASFSFRFASGKGEREPSVCGFDR